MPYHPYMDFCRRERATPAWKRTMAHRPVAEQGRELGRRYRGQAPPYRGLLSRLSRLMGRREEEKPISDSDSSPIFEFSTENGQKALKITVSDSIIDVTHNQIFYHTPEYNQTDKTIPRTSAQWNAHILDLKNFEPFMTKDVKRTLHDFIQGKLNHDPEGRPSSLPVVADMSAARHPPRPLHTRFDAVDERKEAVRDPFSAFPSNYIPS